MVLDARARLVLLALLLVPCAASAGNENGVFFGSDAMITGGAASALTEDGTALQYNPAGLRPVATRVGASASVFGLRLHSVDALFRDEGGDRGSAKATELVSIPSATTFARALGEHGSFGIGLFVPRSSNYVLRGRLDLADGSTWVAATSETSRELRGSVGMAYHWGPFSLGASFDLGLTTEFSASSSAGGIEATGENLVIAETASRNVLGLAGRAGFLWRLGHWRLGLAFTSPTLSVLRAERVDTFSGGAVGEARVFSIAPKDDFVADLRMVAPAFGRVGVAWRGERFTFACDVLVATPSPDRVWNVDVMAGMQVRLSPLVSLGAGAFTDRSGRTVGASLAKSAIDFYGLSGGISFGTQYHRADAATPIKLGTTIGFRYAYGVGTLKGVAVPETFGQGARAAETPAHVQEFMFLLGSSLDL